MHAKNLPATVFLAVLLISALLGWYRLTHLDVSVNGRPVQIRYGQTVLEAVESSELTFVQPVLVDASGNIIAAERNFKVYVNDEPVDLSSRITGPVTIELVRPIVKHEPVHTSYRIDHPAPEFIGTGPFIHMVRDSIPAVSATVSGLKTGRVKNHTVFKGFPAIYRRTDGRGEKICALTFDDGPSIYTPQILNILDRYGVKATFFMIGLHIERHPDIAALVASKGHTIGNHSYSHPAMGKLSAEDIKAELDRTANLLKKHTGSTTRWFRPPMRSLSSLLFKTATEEGYEVVLWDVDPMDWTNPDYLTIYNRVVSATTPGAVILLHDGGGNREQTIRALPLIIKTLLRRGYTFVSLDKYAATYRKESHSQ